MSWVNNDSLAACKIWVGDADGAEVVGNLFVNGAHQVKVTVGVTFTQSTPTSDELNDAIIFIDDISGAEITRFTSTTTEGKYTTNYIPNNSSSTSPVTTPDLTAYNNTATFYLSTDTGINPTGAGQTISVKFALPDDKGGTEYISCSTHFEGVQCPTNISITCYPVPRHTLDDFEMPNDTPSGFTYDDWTDGAYGTNANFAVYRFRFSSGDFSLQDMTPTAVTFIDDYCIGIKYEDDAGAGEDEWWEAYDLTNKAGMGVTVDKSKVKVNLCFDMNAEHVPGAFTGDITPKAGEYLFGHGNATLPTHQDYSPYGPDACYDAHDHFGNPIVISFITYSTESPIISYAG